MRVARLLLVPVFVFALILGAAAARAEATEPESSDPPSAEVTNQAPPSAEATNQASPSAEATNQASPSAEVTNQASPGGKATTKEATTTSRKPNADTTYSNPPAPLYRIHLPKGEWVDAVRVDAWTGGMVRYKLPSGEIKFVGAERVKSIKDWKGDEHRDGIIQERRSIGNDAEIAAAQKARREKGPWLPYRERRHYFVTELSTAWSGGGETDHGFQGSVVGTGFGWMNNISRNWAMGPVVQFISNVDDYHMAGLGLRARRYMNERWSLDGTVGLFTADYSRDEVRNSAPIFGEFAATGWDAVSFFTRFERHDFSFHRGVYFGGAPPAVDVSETTIRVGLRLGPRPSRAAIPAAALGTFVVLSGDRGSNLF